MNLSVIIPCYNCAATLEAQLAALAAQRWEGTWEVIVADNRSTDATVNVVRKFQKNMPNLRLIDASTKQGRSFARNEGVRASRGEYLAFVDGDDVVADGWVAAIAQALQEHDFVASRHEFGKLNPPSVQASRGNAQSEGLQPYTNPPFLPHAGGCGLGIRRALHNDVGGFDERFSVLEDTDYCWRVQLLGYDLVFVKDAIVHVRFRHSSEAIYKQAKDYGEANVHLYKRYRPQGMPELPLGKGLAAWVQLVASLNHLADPVKRQRWLWQLGWRSGRLVGSLKHRILAF